MIYTRAHYLLNYLGCLLMMLVLPLFYSCSSDDGEIYDYDEEVIDGDYKPVDSIADGEKIVSPVFLSSGLNASFEKAIEKRVANRASSIDDGVVVVTDMAGLSSIDIADGTVVVVYKPSSDLLGEGEDAICVAFQKGGYGSCTIGHPSANMSIDECLNQLVDWINSSTVVSNDGEGMEEIYVSASYSGQLREQINKVLWSKPDSIIGDYTVNVKLNIRPCVRLPLPYHCWIQAIKRQVILCRSLHQRLLPGLLRILPGGHYRWVAILPPEPFLHLHQSLDSQYQTLRNVTSAIVTL